MSSPADATHARLVCEESLHQLFAWAAALKPEDVPDAAMRRAAQILFDDISAMVGAWTEPEFRQAYPTLMKNSSSHACTVFCRPGAKADPETAALVNAVSANWLELDEGYRTTPCHAGLYVLPALLASAETDPVPTNTLIATLAVAYELITRIARAFSQQPAVMQSHGRFAALGAAMAVALHRRLPASQLSNLAGSAATLITPAPRNHLALGALVRNVWAGVGARTGMNLADWAPAGITGTAGSLYDVYCTVLRGSFQPEVLTEELGQSWAVTHGYTKMYACCQHLHAAIEAVLDIRSSVWEKGVDNITQIHVLTHDLALPLQNPKPHNTLSAKFSMAHAIATALLTGQGGAQAFHSDTISDAASIEVYFSDGSKVVGECPVCTRGADRPFSRQEFLDKIAQLTAPVYPALLEASWAGLDGKDGDTR
jgi:Uncharacterized protein involved in propionate catabolism